MKSFRQNPLLIGITLAILAVTIWSGNFVIARGVIKQIHPVSLAFYRWLTASVILFPFAFNKFREEIQILKQNWKYFFWISLFGITLFNTFIYVAGRYSPAINLALIGTTSSPVMSIILAAIFLNEKIKPLRIAGLLICIAGIVLLLSQGSWERLAAFSFTAGDGWILLAAFCFAVYNIFVRRKPSGISAINFLFITFSSGMLLLLPAYIWEANRISVTWNINLFFIILYLGLGTSVVSYLCWNAAIARLGAGRTALFGNLIPIFSTLEAIIFLDEQITLIHIISGVLVIGGLIIANLRKSNSV